MQREGDVVPGSASATFSDLNDVIRQRYSMFNELGQISGVDWLRTSVGGVTTTNDTGVWRFGGGGAGAVVAREAGAAAGISPSRFYGNIAGSPYLNDVGQITFSAPLRTTAGGATTGAGIWITTPAGVPTLIARDGQAAPDIPGATFLSMVRPALNNAGEYAFSATLAVAGSVTSSNDRGIWVSRGDDPLALMVREETPAPGANAATGFSVFQDLVINQQGRAAFQASLAAISGAGESGVTNLNDTGIWAEGASGLALVAREGDQPPEVSAGVEFDLFVGPTVNAVGQVAFMGNLRGAGVTTTNDLGIFAQDMAGVLRLIVREGDQLDVDDGPAVDLRTVSGAGFFADGGGEDGSRIGINDLGQLAFLAYFTDGSSGVFVSDLVANAPPQFAADFNEDGVVDGDDLIEWRDGFGDDGDAGHMDGDADADLDVDGEDFLVWQRQLGSGLSVAADETAAGAVPEPAGAALMLSSVSCFAVTHLRRRVRCVALA